MKNYYRKGSKVMFKVPFDLDEDVEMGLIKEINALASQFPVVDFRMLPPDESVGKGNVVVTSKIKDRMYLNTKIVEPASTILEKVTQTTVLLEELNVVYKG